MVKTLKISHDFGDKLLAYKKIDSLQYAIFVSQYQPFVTVYERKGRIIGNSGTILKWRNPLR